MKGRRPLESPAAAEGLVEEADALLARGKHAGAAAAYQRAIELSPELVRAHNGLGRARMGLRRFEEAAAAFRQAAAVDPRAAYAHRNLGEALSALRRPAEAIAAFRCATELAPEWAQAHNALGLALATDGQWREAEPCFRRAVEIDDTFADAFGNLGTSLAELGRRRKALRAFEDAIRCDPRHAKSYYNMHALLLAEPDLRRARSALERAVELEPNWDDARFYLGVILDRMGESTAAARQFERVRRDARGYSHRLDSFQYVKQHAGPETRILGNTAEVLLHALDAAPGSGLVLELGVRHGTSIRIVAGKVEGPVHGFDTFEGLPETWHDVGAGAYSTRGVLPDVPPNVELHVGLFEETLGPFLETHTGPLRFANVDCDLYTSAAVVLHHLAPRFVPGTVLVFDDYFMNERWREDEHRALREASAEHGFRYDYLAVSLFTRQAAIRIS